MPHTQVYRHSAFSGHDTGAWHPEHPSRITAIDRELIRRGLLSDRPSTSWEPATDEQILRVHTPDLLQRLTALSARGGGAIDPDTIVQPDSLHTSRLAAGAGISAVNAIASGSVHTAFVLGRPPGHHATPNRAMGFCLLNTIAITAEQARESGFERVVILDWDVHHGNGTQEIFVERDDVLFCSSHRYDGRFFPGTGASTEQGSGNGAGYTINVPLRPGDGDVELLQAFEIDILPAVKRFRPDLILISAGYDAHMEDPLGGLQVSDSGFRTLASMVCETAELCGSAGIIAVLEGGYHPAASARCIADTLDILDAVSL